MLYELSRAAHGFLIGVEVYQSNASRVVLIQQQNCTTSILVDYSADEHYLTVCSAVVLQVLQLQK